MYVCILYWSSKGTAFTNEWLVLSQETKWAQWVIATKVRCILDDLFGRVIVCRVSAFHYGPHVYDLSVMSLFPNLLQTWLINTFLLMWVCVGWYFFRCGLFMQLLQEEGSPFLLLSLPVTVMYVLFSYLFWQTMIFPANPNDNTTNMFMITFLFCTVGSMSCCCRNTVTCSVRTAPLYIPREFLW